MNKGRLWERLCDARELERAWLTILARYKKNNLPPEVAAYDQKRGHELARLAAELRSQRFLPDVSSLIHIPKPSKPGETRKISLVKPDDRIVLTALNWLLEPLFAGQFAQRSFAYRKGRSALGAVERVEFCLRHGLEHVALGDVDNFFDTIDRRRLLTILKATVWETRITELIETYLYIGEEEKLTYQNTGRGIAQGSPISPLFSNVYLAAFDQYLDATGVEWARYADNLILLAQDPTLVHDAFLRAEQWLATERGLKLNADSKIFTNWGKGFEFLGFWLQDGKRLMSPARLDRKKVELSDVFRQWRGGLPGLVESISETAKGWRNYYGSGTDTHAQLLLLEQHIFDLLVDWLRRYRTAGGGKDLRAAELKATLVNIQLPVLTDLNKRVKWVEMALARSRPEKAAPEPRLSETTRKAVERRREELRKRKDERADVVVSERGTYLGRTGQRLIIRREGKRERDVPLEMIRNISLLTSSATISAELMREASSRGIAIHVIGDDGRPAVRVGPIDSTDFDVASAQMRLAASAAGLDLAREFIQGKVRNQINVLRHFAKHKERRCAEAFLPEAQKGVLSMEAMLAELPNRVFGANLDLERNQLFAAEGQAALSYWAAMKRLAWAPVNFEARVHRGAGDLVNVLLNYGYGILYSRVLRVLIRAGLDPNVGFLHKPRGGKPVLSYDLIEEFRPAAVDRVVFGLLNLGRKLELADGRLSDASRKLLAGAVLDRLHAPTRYRSERVPMEVVLEEQARLLKRHVEDKDKYRAWVWQW